MQTVGSLLQKGLKLHPVVKMGLILSVFVSLVPLSCLAGWNSFSIFTGEMTSIAMDPSDAERVYAGTRHAGVFRTINGGKTWQAARKGLNFYPVRSLAVAPSQPSTIYAGADFDGVWKSLDGGDTWAKTSHGVPGNLIVFRLVVHPTNPNVVYAAMGGGVALCIGNVYRSNNGGATWVKRDKGIPRDKAGSPYTLGAVKILSMDPLNPARLYSTTNRTHGVFTSYDGGATWVRFNKGFPAQTNVYAVAANPHRGGEPAAVAFSFTTGTRYFIFDRSWMAISNPVFTGSQIHFHPTNPSVIYLADSYSRSLDGGVTWDDSAAGMEHHNPIGLSFNAAAPDRLYAATDPNVHMPWGGVFRSDDGGDTWSRRSAGIRGEVVRTVVVDPSSSRYLYVGTGTGGVIRSADGGRKWKWSSWRRPPYDNKDYLFGFEVTDIAVDPLHPWIVFVASNDLYKSTNRGLSFKPLDSPLIVSPRCIAIDPKAPKNIYVGQGKGIVKSRDYGKTWRESNNGLPKEPWGDFATVNHLAVDPMDSSDLWAALDAPHGVYLSTNGGLSWEYRGLKDKGTVHVTAMQPGNSRTIVAGLDSNFEGAIFKSTDGGKTWVKKPLESGVVYDLAFDAADPSVLYAATEFTGVYRSMDACETWSEFNKGIFYPNTYSLDFIPANPPVPVVGSYGSGLYRWGSLPAL